MDSIQGVYVATGPVIVIIIIGLLQQTPFHVSQNNRSHIVETERSCSQRFRKLLPEVSIETPPVGLRMKLTGMFGHFVYTYTMVRTLSTRIIEDNQDNGPISMANLCPGRKETTTERLID